MNSSSETFDYRKWPNCAAALMMSMNCIFGFLLNGAIIYIFLIDSHQRASSFNLMCAIRAFNSIAALATAFFLVYIPDSLLGFSIYPPWLESILICLSLNFYLFNEFQSIYISVNRFIAIYLPTYYEKLCGHKATILIHVALFVHRVQNVVIETWERTSDSKYISFSPEYLMFSALEVSGTGMVWLFGAMFGVALSANLLTFSRISVFYLKSAPSDDTEKYKRIQRNALLFLQTVLQDALFFMDNLFTFNLSSLGSHRFWFFICASFVWQSVHVIDGFIMILFNDRLQLLRNAFFASTTVSKSESIQVKVSPNRASLPDVA